MTIKKFIERAIEGGWRPYSDDYTEKPSIEIVSHDEFFDGEYGEDEMIKLSWEENEDGYGAARGGGEFAEIGLSIYQSILDPLAWKAVGKVEGWKEDTHYTDEGVRVRKGTNYVDKMHRMIDALAEGKTIEQFLETL